MNEIWACVYAQNAKYFKIYGLRDAIIISMLVFANASKWTPPHTI